MRNYVTVVLFNDDDNNDDDGDHDKVENSLRV